MQTPTISPVHFGTADRRLFGIYHRAAEGRASGCGVLVCNPFGQEAMRAQRALWALAERLSRAGHPVLRFDYYGAGDSMGDDLDADLDGWSSDVFRADQELRLLSGVERTTWIGMRLGAVAALRAANQSLANVTRLILWDPVVDGGSYLRHLREQHAASLSAAFSLPLEPSPDHLLSDPDRYRDEAIGFALSPRMRMQIERLSAERTLWPESPRLISVFFDPDAPGLGDVGTWSQRAPRRVRFSVLRHGVDWTSDSAENSMLVPAPALAQLALEAVQPA